MFGGLCRKFCSILKREAAHENEPQRILFLLRIILLILGIYFLIIPGILFILGSKVDAGAGYIFCVLAAVAFYATYRLRVHTCVLIASGLQLGWIVVFVVLYGWDCGIQHLMFEMLVLVYFSIYNSLGYKIGYTVFLFAVRFGLFLYCRGEVSVLQLTELGTVVLQIINTILTFILMAVACSMFSSNVESAEKKLVLYNEQLKKQAGTDPLTGLWNRRQMLEFITEKRRREPEMAFTLGMGDIDFFKKINDKWGHDCGDAVLVWLARRISEELPDEARLCRWGGEEFIFFFPRENGDVICRFLDDLRMKLDNPPFDWRGERIPITMTFGVEENDFRSDIDTLLKNVDNKLYIGKKQGRDCVIY